MTLLFSFHFTNSKISLLLDLKWNVDKHENKWCCLELKRKQAFVFVMLDPRWRKKPKENSSLLWTNFQCLCQLVGILIFLFFFTEKWFRTNVYFWSHLCVSFDLAHSCSFSKRFFISTLSLRVRRSLRVSVCIGQTILNFIMCCMVTHSLWLTENWFFPHLLVPPLGDAHSVKRGRISFANIRWMIHSGLKYFKCVCMVTHTRMACCWKVAFISAWTVENQYQFEKWLQVSNKERACASPI